MGFRGAGEAVGVCGGSGGCAGAVADGGRGTIVNGSRNRGLQVRALRHDGWTKARRAQFLRVLGTTCNVEGAVASVGLALSGAYALRLRDPVFAASWAAALGSGYDRLEEALLAAAIAGLRGDWGDEPREAAGGERAGSGAGSGDDAVLDTGPDTGVVRLASMQAVQVALAILGRYRAAQAEGGKRQKTRHRRATPEETNASIGKKLDALAKRLAALPPVAVIVLDGPSGDAGVLAERHLGGPGAVVEHGGGHE